jgi:hypothetical protein
MSGNQEVEEKSGMTSKQCKPHTKVGIFWCVDGVIIGVAVPQEEARPYGEALQYGGHYEFWEKLISRILQERTFKSHAYVFYPRGRMVLFPKRLTVRLDVDRCMDNEMTPSMPPWAFSTTGHTRSK